ncbi:crossover junction endodeoxyribonuclease RuvC [Tersicoccus phoenicis]|uniref:Crossover junction endodeoxyribonuclease RuvC n=1 Tax=Tersicoccus phoenicis TaxID=554083 RepID=A0A1R1LA11_9MICC|nr:crossover junction endodeoxyribonuclease RuvC [Tersicoccus phoenicis]OMH24385.1 crossover junction endodeoxyribonuclease RuvC [Tersicoccus phoenicis]
MTLRVLGVDPGLTRCGLGVVDVAANRRATLVEVGVVGTAASESLDARLLAIDAAVEQWLDRHQPDVLAVERVFSQLNVSTVMGTAQASGVVIAAAARRGIAVALHTPTEVKAAVTGNGQADKGSVARMVVRILRLSEAPTPADAADALALAITHAWRSGLSAAAASAAASPSRSGAAAAARSSQRVPSGALTAAQLLWVQAEASARQAGHGRRHR